MVFGMSLYPGKTPSSMMGGHYPSASESMLQLFKIAGQEHPDRHRPTAGIKQWMALAVDTCDNA